ncbi:uncharacterized protein KY384_003263 [Bacidia gigantensis]|uniref:uncharacterized protein n=1 Tax=Bacidia gigantensis TaxID=2732470 RepID=UPI001D0416B9|nr:uncharacterized protein KY384_003263 [Bacidia gigantensis]KAG8531632.1 hypothetical protein KY384_003263 [Bacidia gigantensis]
MQVCCAQDAARQDHDILAGCILWLPRRDEIDEHLLVGADIGNGCFNHPIVVLSADQVGGKATVLILTSFDGQDLAKRHPENRHLRDHHLPIFPSAAHPDNGILLSLDSDLQLRKKSYIKTEVQVIINVASLIPYNRTGKKYKLQQKSYHTLATYINFTPPTANPRPRRDLSNQFSVYSPPSSLPIHAGPRPSSRTIQRTPPQIPPTRYYSPVTSQAPAPPPSYLIPIVTNTRQDSPLYSVPRRDRRTPLPPYTHPSSTPSPSKPEPGFDILVAFIFSLVFLGFLGAVSYEGYRVFLRGRWALREIKGKWSEAHEVLMRARPLEYIKAIFTKFGPCVMREMKGEWSDA